MNRDDIIRMAREAGIEVHTRKGEIRIGSALITGCDSTEEVLRFAALVAAHEREACAQACEAMNAKCDFAGPAVFARVIRARREE